MLRKPGGARSKKVVIIEEVLEDGEVVRYERGKLLGKGGFATCYELRDTATDEVCAAKCVSKKSLSEALRAQLQEEISLHALATDGTGHANVLQFYSSFEDEKCVFLLLEVARHGTLMDVVAARTRLTEPECQYWMPQLFAGLDHVRFSGQILGNDLVTCGRFPVHHFAVQTGTAGEPGRRAPRLNAE